MQVSMLMVCLEAVQATDSVPEVEVARIQKKLTILATLRRLHHHLAEVLLSPADQDPPFDFIVLAAHLDAEKSWL